MASSAAPKDRPAIEAGLDLKPYQAIGRALRAHYDDLLREPLPQRFEELLSRLDGDSDRTRKDAPQDKASGAGE